MLAKPNSNIKQNKEEIALNEQGWLSTWTKTQKNTSALGLARQGRLAQAYSAFMAEWLSESHSLSHQRKIKRLPESELSTLTR